MKHKKFYAVLIAVVLVMTCFIISCDETVKEEKGKERDPNKPVVLKSFYPDSGKIRTRVILNGENFGSDPSKIKVYFNQKRAAVIGSNGDLMYAIVPRIAEDRMCDISVVVDDDSVVYTNQFRYKVTVSVSTVVGNGTFTNRMGTLDVAQIGPFQMDVDGEGNIFVGVEGGFDGIAPPSGTGVVGFVRISEAENTMELISNMGSIPGDGYGPRFESLNADKTTGMLYARVRQNALSFVTIDPADNWIPRYKTFTCVDNPGYPGASYPTQIWAYMGYNQFDGYLYIRYNSGHLVRVDPKTAEGMVLYITPQTGTSEGIDFDPKNPDWCYVSGYADAGTAHGIYRFNVKDAPNTWERLNLPTSAGYRDGPIANAMFYSPYGLRFDSDGIAYIADLGNSCIRKYNPETGIVTTVLGKAGTPNFKDGGIEDALFNQPSALGISLDGNVYVSDRLNRRIRKLSIE